MSLARFAAPITQLNPTTARTSAGRPVSPQPAPALAGRTPHVHGPGCVGVMVDGHDGILFRRCSDQILRAAHPGTPLAVVAREHMGYYAAHDGLTVEAA